MEQDKLNFARKCKNAEIGFKNRKKLLKDTGIAFIFPAIFAIVMSIAFPLVLAVLGLEIALYSAFILYAHHCNVNDINHSGEEINFTYKDYKQMKNSGELETLYKQIEEIDKKEAEERYKEYLEFVKFKSYTSVNTSFTEENKEAGSTIEVDNINNL